MVSIIVPVHNGAATLQDCVRAVLNQREIDIEVLAIDDSSTDNSLQILSALAQLDSRLVVEHHQSNLGLSRTLNEGIKKARNELLLIIHQDCSVHGNEWLHYAVLAMERLNADLVSGVPSPSSITMLERVFLLFRAHRLALPSPREIPWTEFKCDLTRRALLCSVGGFDESYRVSGEDQDLCYKLRKIGARLYQVPELSYSVRVDTLAGWIPHLKKEYLYGETQAALLIRTSMGILKGGTTSFGGERVRNRALGVVWILTFILGLLSLTIFGFIGLLPFGILYLLRLGILTSRVFDPSYSIPLRAIPRVWIVGTIADLIYTCGLARGALGHVLTTVARRLR